MKAVANIHYNEREFVQGAPAAAVPAAPAVRRQLNATTAKNTYQVMVNRRQRDTIDELRKEVEKLRAERGMLVRAVTGGGRS